MLALAVERWREYVKKIRTQVYLVRALDFQRMFFGPPLQNGALALTFQCDHRMLSVQ